jgi:hypothetical protein
VTVDDGEVDKCLAALEELRTWDVSARRALRLRRRCHALLQTPPRPRRSAGLTSGTLFRRVVAPAIGGVWCVAYLVEIIRVAAAIYLVTR